MPHRRAAEPSRPTPEQDDPYGYGIARRPERWDDRLGWYGRSGREGHDEWDEDPGWDGTERWDDTEQAAAWAAHDEWRQPEPLEAVQRRARPRAEAVAPRRDLREDLASARDWAMRASGLAEATPGVDRAARVIECSLALIFYWFGLLKLFPHVSPAEELGGRTVQALTLHLIPFRLGVTMLGLLEIGLAIGLYLIPRYTWVLWLVMAHLVGTFAPFLLFPGMTLGGVPGSLSLVGQYIVKNVVLLGAVWFLIQHHRTLGLKLRRR